MNVIVSNKQKNIIDNANIDAIKDLNGLFSVDDLINKFKNYFFSKMILDATSVIDFTSDEVLNRLARDIGSDRLIILLPASPEPPKEFTDKLINLKIYNFSNKIEDIVKFISYPNNYSDVSKDDGLYVDNSITENENMTNDVTNNGSYSDMLTNFNVEEDYQDNKSNINNNDEIAYQSDNNDLESNIENANSLDSELNNIVPDRIDAMPELNDNFNDNINPNDISNLDNNVMNNNIVDNNALTNEELAYHEDNGFYGDNTIENNSNEGFLNQKVEKKIIGIKNVTLHAGSTTLTYLLMKMLKDKYKKNVLAVEINKNDFKYYQDNTLISISAGDINNVINNGNEVIIVDLNDCHDTSFCNDIIYLVEPSIIKLNRLMMENRFIFRELFNKKIVLNKSLLSSSDVNALSKEAGVGMFMNIPPVNDRMNNQVIEDLIKKLGLN